MKTTAFLAALCAALSIASSWAQAPASATDPFRALEDASRPETEAFFRDEAARARAELDRIPGRAALLARIRALSGAQTIISWLAVANGTRVFYLRLGPRDETAVLCTRETISGAERVIADPRRIGPGAAIEGFAASPDGHHIAYGITTGTDASLRVVDNLGADAGFAIDRVRYPAEVGWAPDGRSFYYPRIPEDGERARRFANTRVYRHVLGRDTARDEIVFAPGVGGARDVPEFVNPSIVAPTDSRYAYAIAREGMRRELAVHVTEQRDLAAAHPRWRKLVGYEDGVLAVLPAKDDLYLLTYRNAPRHRVLRVKATATEVHSAKAVVPEGDSVIREMALAKDALYLRTMVAGVDRLERVQIGLLGARAPQFVRTPFDNAITDLVAHPRADGALLRLEGGIDPAKILQVDVRGELRDTRLQPPNAFDISGLDEVRLYAPTPDGSKIPVTLVYRKSTTLTGANPTILTAAGSFGDTATPTFDAADLAWLERGGIFAIAHVRGGGEYGEQWREAGRGANKLTTVRDFITVSEFLVSYGFTRPKRLAILGEYAGAIPVGGALVRRPELYAAAVVRAPLLDMTRYERMARGGEVVPEFGSAATPKGLENLRAMSAYDQVRDNVAYPAVLLLADPRDTRVERWQPGKMAVRLQGATTSGKPVLLRVGETATRTQRDEELADVYAFLLWQMDERDFQPVTVPAPAAAPTPPAAAPTPPPAAPEPAPPSGLEPDPPTAQPAPAATPRS